MASSLRLVRIATAACSEAFKQTFVVGETWPSMEIIGFFAGQEHQAMGVSCHRIHVQDDLSCWRNVITVD